MKIKPQIRWVAVNPEGHMFGPFAITLKAVKRSLIEGFFEAIKIPGNWKDIEKMGYKIIKCRVIPIEKEKKVEDKTTG